MADWFAPIALLPAGWARDVRVSVDAGGTITAVEAGADPVGAQRLDGPVVPGMPNLHSHAFQRAMAGLAERAADRPGSFWSWRAVMYRFAAALDPAGIEAVATHLYIEMLKAGYTAVAEFHYLHNQPDGTPYQDPGELAWRIDAAARRAGIGLTLLPVLYRQAGFGGIAPEPLQRRFVQPVDQILALIAACQTRWAGDGDRRVGLAPHSLRAVTPTDLAVALRGLDEIDPTAPVHLHIAEQTAEVEGCLAWSGQRPVAWALDYLPVGPRWCLVHATHLDETEIDGIAASGAVVGLCPTTEANLGDGLFPLDRFLARGGIWGIGSDSQISVSPVEELRWLDYGRRLINHRRTAMDAAPGEGIGARLWRQGLAGGAQALGRPIGALAVGARADLLVLDQTAPLLRARTEDSVLDTLVFAGNSGLVRDVMVGGVWRVRDRHHPAEAASAAAFGAVLDRLNP